MEWFIIGFFLYILLLSISNWVKFSKGIEKSNWELLDKILMRIALDAATILILATCFRRICLTLVELNIL